MPPHNRHFHAWRWLANRPSVTLLQLQHGPLSHISFPAHATAPLPPRLCDAQATLPEPLAAHAQVAVLVAQRARCALTVPLTRQRMAGCGIQEPKCAGHRLHRGQVFGRLEGDAKVTVGKAQKKMSQRASGFEESMTAAAKSRDLL